VYANLLGEKVKKHKVQVWLVNTGWTGGPYGEGRRMKLSYTRKMVDAALNGDLDDVELETESYFGLRVPKHVEDIPQDILHTRKTWKDPKAYDRQADKLIDMFHENFKPFEAHVDKKVIAAGPRKS